MTNLNAIDHTVMGLYFSCLVGMGLYLRKRAYESVEDYLMGRRKLPWWALGVIRSLCNYNNESADILNTQNRIIALWNPNVQRQAFFPSATVTYP